MSQDGECVVEDENDVLEEGRSEFAKRVKYFDNSRVFALEGSKIMRKPSYSYAV